MDDKELEKVVNNYFDNEVPEPNQQILNELKTHMHKRTTSSTKSSYKKFRLALVTCIAIILIIPAVTLPFMWNNFFPSTPDNSTPEVEIHYSDSNLTMVDFTPETLNSILVGEFSKYATLIEGFTINFSRGYYSEDNILVYLDIDMTKNNIPFTEAKLGIVFVENYEHEFSKYFGDVLDFIQYDNCKLYESIYDLGYKKLYYKFFEFEDYKVYLQLDKKDSSIINSIIQN